MSSFVIVQVQRLEIIFRAFVHKNKQQLCFSSGALSAFMCLSVSIDPKAQSWCQCLTDRTKHFRFWFLVHLWLVAERSCGHEQLLQHQDDQMLCCTNLKSFPWEMKHFFNKMLNLLHIHLLYPTTCTSINVYILGWTYFKSTLQMWVSLDFPEPQGSRR